MSIEPKYDFQAVEGKIYDLWTKNGCFHTSLSPSGQVLDGPRAKAPTHTIVIPPPNVTGRLHMGHALNNTIQDMLTRYKRMDGYDALWIPGMDHAGIATQTVVKKMLDADGVDYREMGREQFIDKVWEWKDKFGGIILKQLERIGASCDWERTRFTMDDSLSEAVNYCFKKLYDEGLVYRGKRIVNWCPVDRTALSDDEVETKEGGEKGFLWHINYPLSDGSGHLTVATTRPETLFGDVAVAVHPEDERFKKYIGKTVTVPLQGREIPVIADDYVDKEFGTGCLKITPAHDANDFEVGQRHNLEPINVMNEDATMNEVVPKEYQGLDRFKCRTKAVDALKEQELLVLEEERMTPLGRSYRSKAVIEYRLSDQWFVKMKPLAEKTLAKHSELNILPARWDKVYLDWMTNIRDWCVSRQIWWGHRIPAWYHKETGEILVDVETPQAVKDNPDQWEQESDVLDTWFSSALWPMSTLGWPKQSKDFERYFPTQTLVTGKDIIFFWVARMNMMSVHFTGQLPYKNVFINPIVLDEKGETMSKSKGNGIDPMVVVEGASLEDLKGPVQEARPSNMKEIIKRIEKNYPEGYEGVGADALRYTLLYLCSGGQQLRISLNSFHDLGRRFLTKLWNAARFLSLGFENEKSKPQSDVDFSKHLRDEDIWIQTRFKETAKDIRQMMDTNDLNQLGETLYRFVWNDFCDWYIELCKVRLNSDNDAERKTALHQLAVVFTNTLKLLHPIVPYISEELWQKLIPLVDEAKLWGQAKPSATYLVQADYPKVESLSDNEKNVLDRFATLQNLIGQFRSLRKTYQIKDGEKLVAAILPLSESATSLVSTSNDMICRLAGLSSLQVVQSKEQKPAKTVTLVDQTFEAYLDVSAFVDVQKETERLKKEIEKLDKQILPLNKRLQNPNFVNNAKPEIVSEQKAQLSALQDKSDKLNQLMTEVKSWN